MDLIETVFNLLEQPLPETEQEIEESLALVEALRPKVLKERVQAQVMLLKKRHQYLHPKDKDFTNLDREIMLESNLTAETERFELLAGLEVLLKDRHATLRLLLDI